MKKFLIGGVSLFAILSANNALAAGYTCEELIEYTSCNPGYFLSKQTISNGDNSSGGDITCPDGYDLVTGFCGGTVDGLLYSDMTSQEECYSRVSEDFGEDVSDNPDIYYYQYACVSQENSEDHYSVSAPSSSSPTSPSAISSCVECPVGSYCAGGDAAAVACSGETYADVMGLAACKSCRDAAGTIGVTDGMIESITGGTTCEYDLKITANHAVIDGVTCSLNEYEPDNYCEFSGGSDTVKCDAGYYFQYGSPTGDCTEDYPGWYGCSDFYTTISDVSDTFSCSQVPVGSFSPAGSWNAYKCPTITDAAGNVIATTTESAGSTSASDCFVGSSVTFKDNKGEYRYRENCKYDISQPDVSTPEKCIAAGWKYDSYRLDGDAYDWYEDYCEIDGNVDFSQYIRYEDGVCVSHFGDEQENTTYDGTKCVCNGNWRFFYQDNSVFCQ